MQLVIHFRAGAEGATALQSGELLTGEIVPSSSLVVRTSNQLNKGTNTSTQVTLRRILLADFGLDPSRLLSSIAISNLIAMASKLTSDGLRPRNRQPGNGLPSSLGKHRSLTMVTSAVREELDARYHILTLSLT